MSMTDESKKEKGSLLDKLPKLGRVSHLMLLVGIFLIIVIPLWVFYQQQPGEQAELKNSLSNLEKILAVPVTKKEKLEAEIKQVEAETEAAREAFPEMDNSDVPERLLELGESNDVDVTIVEELISQQTIGEQVVTFAGKSGKTTEPFQIEGSKWCICWSLKAGKLECDVDGVEWPIATYIIHLDGQVPKFQNFLLGLDDKLPTCRVKEVKMEVADVEGEEDTANVIIDVFYPKEECERVTDGGNAELSLSVYPEGETGSAIKTISHSGGSRVGTTYIYEGEGCFYIKVVVDNLKDWRLEIYEFYE